jgi:hypothetical protein
MDVVKTNGFDKFTTESGILMPRSSSKAQKQIVCVTLHLELLLF